MSLVRLPHCDSGTDIERIATRIGICNSHLQAIVVSLVNAYKRFDGELSKNVMVDVFIIKFMAIGKQKHSAITCNVIRVAVEVGTFLIRIIHLLHQLKITVQFLNHYPRIMVAPQATVTGVCPNGAIISETGWRAQSGHIVIISDNLFLMQNHHLSGVFGDFLKKCIVRSRFMVYQT